MSNSADNSTENEPLAAESSMSANSNDEHNDSLPFAAEQSSPSQENCSVEPAVDAETPPLTPEVDEHSHETEDQVDSTPFSALKIAKQEGDPIKIEGEDFSSDTAVFAPAVVFGNLNPDLLGKIEGEIYAYDAGSFQPYSGSTQLDMAPVGLPPVEISASSLEEESIKENLPLTPTAEILDFSDVSETIPIPQAPEGTDQNPQEWEETRYSDSFIRDFRTSSVEQDQMLPQETPFPDDQSLHQVHYEAHGGESLSEANNAPEGEAHVSIPTLPHDQHVVTAAQVFEAVEESGVVYHGPKVPSTKLEAIPKEDVSVQTSEKLQNPQTAEKEQDTYELASAPSPPAPPPLEASQPLAPPDPKYASLNKKDQDEPQIFKGVTDHEDASGYSPSPPPTPFEEVPLEEHSPYTEDPSQEYTDAPHSIREEFPDYQEEEEIHELTTGEYVEIDPSKSEEEEIPELAKHDTGGYFQEFGISDDKNDESLQEPPSYQKEGLQARVPSHLDRTMRLEAVTFLDDQTEEEVDPSTPELHQGPPRIRRPSSDPSASSISANQGPPPKHRPMGAVASNVSLQTPTQAPPARRTTKGHRPAGPPPKRRATGELPSVSDQRPIPPALRNSGVANRVPPAAGHVAQAPPTRNLPPHMTQPGVQAVAPQQIPPQQIQQPPQQIQQGHPKPHKTPPPVAIQKSSGDPQMDEIIQQLIDENNRKEVASTTGEPPVNPVSNRRLEWFSNYFGDDYLRSISPRQQHRTKREIEFMLRSLRPSPGASILDVACGYGRHSLEFAQRGYEVVGVDLSMTMLKRALNESNKRSAQLKKNLSVRFMQGDMRDIDYQSEFECALLWQDSLGYFDNLGDAEALRKIFNSLKGGGRFLIDTINRDYIVPLLPTRRIWFGVQAEIHEEVFFDSQTSVLFMKRTYLTNNRTMVRDYLSRIRLYSLHELLNLLRYIGFNILEISGDILYRGQHLDHCSPRNIVLAERPRQPQQ